MALSYWVPRTPQFWWCLDLSFSSKNCGLWVRVAAICTSKTRNRATVHAISIRKVNFVMWIFKHDFFLLTTHFWSRLFGNKKNQLIFNIPALTHLKFIILCRQRLEICHFVSDQCVTVNFVEAKIFARNISLKKKRLCKKNQWATAPSECNKNK